MRRSVVNAPGALTIASTLIARSQQPTGLRAPSAMVAPTSPAAEVGARSSPGIDDDDSLFSARQASAAKQKIDLYERVGKAFDLDLEKFADAGKMAERIQAELSKMTSSGILALESSLGLNVIGVSLREVLESMTDSSSDGGRRLDAAPKTQAGELDADGDEISGRLGLDDIGRYSPSSFGL